MTGAEIRAFRAQKQMSQYQLAQLVGTVQNVVSKWEHNQTRPSGVYKARLEWLMHAAPEELDARRDEVRREQAEERRKRRCANPVKPKKAPKPPEKEPTKPAKPTATKTANQCKACPYWQHMDNRKSKTMYCACFQETGHVRTCGVERTYQRHRALSPLSLDAARAAELGVSYGKYKAL
nr:MAG TPA: helix-turn-helix domain protein [Caudoviricetes sp.]